MPIKVVILDDEQAAIDVLTHHISRTPQLQLQESFRDPLEAIAYINANKTDLLFSDIEMPAANGMEVIQSLNQNIPVILTTAYTSYAVRAYDLNVIDYLVKPIGYPRFLQAIQKLQAPPALPATDHFFVKSGIRGGVVKINTDDIILVEGAKNYIHIYHGAEKTITLMNMKDIEAVLPSRFFLRVHRSSIIATRHIVSIEGDLVILTHGLKAVAGPSYKDALLAWVQGNLLNG